MNKFEEYNASQIVPQRTLLEKFNEIIKFLSANPTFNLFISNEDYVNNSTVYNKTSLSNSKNKLEVGDLVVFNNVYVGVVSMVGTITYTISKAIYFKGAVGEKGDSGNNFEIIGTVNSTADLPSSAPYGTAYFVGTQPPRQVYAFDSLTNSWINEGYLQAEISLEETASNMIGDDVISITYDQDAKKIRFTTNLDAYYTKAEIATLLEDYYDKDDIDNFLDGIEDEIDDIKEIAEGKCKSFVINDKSDITGTDSGDEIVNVTAITGITLTDLQVGDNIYIKDVNDADYWVSQVEPSISLSKLETSKVDLLNGIYPVGSVYVSIDNKTAAQVATLFGGTWEKLNSGSPLYLPLGDVPVATLQTKQFDATLNTGGEQWKEFGGGNMPSTHTPIGIFQNPGDTSNNMLSRYSNSGGLGAVLGTVVAVNRYAMNSNSNFALPLYLFKRTA